jgi:Uma2 family endonuclease
MTIATAVPTSTSTTPLLTAEQFLDRYGHLSGVELVRGVVVRKGVAVSETDSPAEVSPMPRFRHGVVSYRAVRAIADFVEANRLGWIAINDTFVRTEDGPDTVRGADVLFVSYARLPDGVMPEDLSVPPELVLEVRSPSDRWNAVFIKVGEYLRAGVTVVLVIDPVSRTVSAYRDDGGQQTFREADELTVPDVLPGFTLPVARLFDGIA